MSQCIAMVPVRSVTDEAELLCFLHEGHQPAVHWDKHVGVHWFQLSEDGAGQTIAASMVPTLDT